MARLTVRRSKSARGVGRQIEHPPAHWALLALVVLGLLLVLFIQGASTGLTGTSGTPAATPSAASPLRPDQTFLAARGQRIVTLGAHPGRRVALTFDDGPDPTWTPRILAALQRLHVPATFFVVGDQVVRHPEIVKEEARDGFEIGNHTFTHASLTDLPGWQRNLQISLTESAVAGAANVRPRLIRPPYSATPGSVTPAAERTYAGLTREGYVIALSNYDGRDWERPGVAQIVRNATPPGRRGGVILLHDGGGDRSQTVAALDRLVPKLERRGFRFVLASRIAGLSRVAVGLPASSSEHLRGELLIATLTVARTLTSALAALLIPIALLAVARAILLFALARRHAGEYRKGSVDLTFASGVSIVVPAYNEATVIEAAVRSLAGSDYPDFEVIVVDDGSTDETVKIVDGLGLPGVRLISQANAGKSVALNTGMTATLKEIIVTVDADTLFEPQTLHRLVQSFSDPGVGAVAGNTKVGNRSGMLGRWQHIDYVMSFNLDRRLYDILRCMPTVPGAIGAFRREALDGVGGFSTATLAEDTDITIALCRAGWRIVYAEDACAFTEVPATWSALWRQRYRWSYGTMQAVWKHKGALVNRGEWRIGRIGIPYLVLFQILLPMLAPFIDVFAVYGLFFLDPLPVLAYWLGFNALLLALAAYAFRLDGESLRPLWAMPLQQFVYRQLMYLVVIQSAISAVRGVRLRWQHVERTGDVEIT